MPKPTTVPTWATNANYAGGPLAGSPTKTTPASGRIQDGWRPNDVPPAQEQNYFQNWVGQWLTWLNALQLTDTVDPGVQISIAGASHVLAGSTLLLDAGAPGGFLIVNAGCLIGVQSDGAIGITGEAGHEGKLTVDAHGQILIRTGGFFQIQSGGSGQLDGPVTFSNAIDPTGAGKVGARRTVGPTSGTVTLSGSIPDSYFVDPTAGNVIVKLDPSGKTVVSPRIRVTVVGASNTTNTVDVQTPGGVSSLPGGVPMKNAAGGIKWADFIFDGSFGQYVCDAYFFS